MDCDLEIVERPQNLAWNEKKFPFLFLPYHIFAEWTNIRSLAQLRNMSENGKPLTDNQLEVRIRTLHRDLADISWGLSFLETLNFIGLAPKDTTASIFRWKKVEAERAYQEATAFQRQFMFLPLSLFRRTTNVYDLAITLHCERFPDVIVTDENLSSFVAQIHAQLPVLKKWRRGGLLKLKFLRTYPEENGYDAERPKSNRGRHSTTTSSTNVLVQEAQPSTSRANQEPSNMIDRTEIDSVAKKAPAKRNVAKRSRQDQFENKPSKVQRKVVEMNVDEFADKTNIKELIRQQHGRMSEESTKKRISNYFSWRFEWDSWEDSCLKNLALKEDLGVTGMSTASPENVSLVRNDENDRVAAKKSKTSFTPRLETSFVDEQNNAHSKLYKKSMALKNVEEFVEKTNIRQLIIEEMEKQKATPSFFEENLRTGIEKMFKVVKKPKHWHLFQFLNKLDFVNVESGPNSSSKDAGKGETAPFPSGQADEAVQVKMLPIHDDVVKEYSEAEPENDGCSGASPSELEPHEPSKSRSPNSSRHYSEQIRFGQHLNLECVDDIPKSQSESVHNSFANASAPEAVDVGVITSPIPISTSTQKNLEKTPDDQETQFDETNNHETLVQHTNRTPNYIESIDEPINDGSSTKIKSDLDQTFPNSSSSRTDDSDVICEGSLIEHTIIIEDTDEEMEEVRNIINAATSDSVSFESLNQEVETSTVLAEQLVSILSDEPSATEEVYTTPNIETTITSIRTGSAMHSSPLQHVENTMNAKPSENRRSLAKRPNDKTDAHQSAAKRSKKAMNDTLSNIQPPRYDYQPLQLINKQSDGTVQRTVGQKSSNV